MLEDSFQRVHDYLRISLTDRCNLKCLYCNPKDMHKEHALPASSMTAAEIEQIAAIFIREGVRKIRLTGGEPLVRKDAGEIIRRLGQYSIQLAITTNGVFVDEYLDDFLSAGLLSVNMSLDTLNREVFFAMTGRDDFQKVFNNIHLMLKHGFHLKINVVVMKGKNEQEILDFIEWTKEMPVHIRFIEFMPFEGNHWDASKVYTHQDILNDIGHRYTYARIPTHRNDTAKPYYISGHLGTFSVISTMSEPFCSGCNRLRLTTDGKMKNCLFSKDETDLLGPFRKGQDIVPLIRQTVWAKKEKLGGQFEGLHDPHGTSTAVNRSMIRIGG